MSEVSPAGEQPPRGPRPPAPPGTGHPGGRPDPSDPGPPIMVRLDDYVLGDLGNPRSDARLLSALLMRDGRVARWLRSRGVDEGELEAAFPGWRWNASNEED